MLTLRTGPLTDGLRVVPWQDQASLVLCRDLAALPDLGSCAPDAQVASVPPDFDQPGTASWTGTVWPSAPLSAEEFAALPVEAVAVGTDGTGAAVERARTLLAVAVPDRTPATIGELRADSGIAQQLAGFRQLADVVVVAGLAIAGCSLAVSVIAGLTDRRRPFGLLRLTGVPLAVLRRVIGLETAVPLLTVAAVATGMGFVAAALFLRSQLDYALHLPGAGYWLLIGVGLLVSLVVVGGTLPLLRRLTGPETARFE